MVLRNHVSAIDELGMATERLRVRLPDEPKPKLLHIIEPHEASNIFLGFSCLHPPANSKHNSAADLT